MAEGDEDEFPRLDNVSGSGQAAGGGAIARGAYGGPGNYTPMPFDGLTGMPSFGMDLNDEPLWAIPDDAQGQFDLHQGGTGFSQASSYEAVTSGAPIGVRTRDEGMFDTVTRGTGHPGDSDRFKVPADPMKPVQIRTATEQYWKMDGQQRGWWQEKMYRAGFIKEPPAWGRPDPTGQDFAGWNDLAKMAARMGVPMSELLDDIIAQREAEGDGPGGPSRRVRDIVLTNTADAERMADAIAVELMGRAPNDEERARAVARLHQLERSGGSRGQVADASETGGTTYEGTVSAQTAIADALEADAPEEVRAHDTADQFAELLGMLGPAGGMA